ncbi:hypothetical protein AWB91_08915 [Mycobacterium paraense]|uniref:DUF393 domain-containing protein n=1 Tax=Mycobacterium paraense TaxID=767916 RepID=A0ABX3VS05_9MYCO|nr:hypothetical protein [Mycobacterium paraense]ORW33237.1 hypothetical protein AWB91_08915 [Mycobacterium paraense]ORW38430.1 hypothetical protein AWB88_17800 [Mycobacterium paraense]
MTAKDLEWFGPLERDRWGQIPDDRIERVRWQTQLIKSQTGIEIFIADLGRDFNVDKRGIEAYLGRDFNVDERLLYAVKSDDLGGPCYVNEQELWTLGIGLIWGVTFAEQHPWRCFFRRLRLWWRVHRQSLLHPFHVRRLKRQLAAEQARHHE